MPWYYAGPDATPVGPISLEELQSRRAAGALSPETYIIEASLQGVPQQWRRYREVFPQGLPPLPVSAPAPAPPHPLFPSAISPSAPASPGGPIFTAHPSTYYPPSTSKMNSACVWGLGLGLAGLPFLFCGVGVFVAMAGLVVSIIGLTQVNRQPGQQGRGLAIGGIVASLAALLIMLVIVVMYLASSLRPTAQMSTEQTTTDADTR